MALRKCLSETLSVIVNLSWPFILLYLPYLFPFRFMFYWQCLGGRYLIILLILQHHHRLEIGKALFGMGSSSVSGRRRNVGKRYFFFPTSREQATYNEMIVAFAKRKWSAWFFLSFSSLSVFGFGARLRLISIFQPSKKEKGIPLLLFLFETEELALFFLSLLFLAARAEHLLFTHPFSLILSCPVLPYLTLPTYSLTPFSLSPLSFYTIHIRVHAHIHIPGSPSESKNKTKRKHKQNNKRSGRASKCSGTKSVLFFFISFFIKSGVFFLFFFLLQTKRWIPRGNLGFSFFLYLHFLTI